MPLITVELTLKKPWSSPNFFNRLHFGAKARTHQALAAELRAQIQPLDLAGPLVNVSIVAIRVAPHSLDMDNLTGGLKPVLDAMGKPASNKPYGIGLIVDDRRSILKRLNTYDEKPSDERAEGAYFMLSGEILD